MEWDLSYLFKNNTEIDTLIEELENNVTKLEKYRKKISGFSPEDLALFLNEFENFQFKRSKLGQFPRLKVNANSKDEEALVLQNKIDNINTKWNKRLAFISLELGELLKNKADYIDDEKLQNRRYYLQRQKHQAQYRLSEEEEIIILEKDQYGVDQWSKLQGELVSKTQFKIEVDGEIEEHSWSSGYGLRSHKKRSIRKAAMKGLGKGLKDNGQIFAYALRNVCANYTTEANRRGYPNYMEQSLFSSHLSKEIVDVMFEVLLDNVDVFQEFLSIKAEILGTKKLKGEDLEAPYPFTSDREIPWEEAMEIVKEGFSEFDPEFGKIAATMFAEKRVDAKPRSGKRAGAFCSTHYEGKSAYIMLSYNNNMDSLKTLSHEMGHAVHAHYITHNQPLLHSSMGMSLAETASEFGSLLFNLKFMREAKTEEERKAVLFEMVDNLMIVLFEVGSRTLFETRLYEALDNDEYLNEEKFDEIYWKARSRVFGDAIEWMEEQSMHWCWKPHYYIPGFRYYNYPYVFGEFSVLSMYAAYREDPEEFTKNYKEFLKSGGSKYPTELFQELFGFELTSEEFWKAGINELRRFVQQCKNYL